MNLKAMGNRIKIARERRGLTQEALAELLDMSPMHISVIERGVKPTRLDTFVRIANILEVTADELLQDVVLQSTQSLADEVSELIRQLPRSDQQKLVFCIKTYAQACEISTE